MPALSLEQIVEASGGTLLRGSPETIVEGFGIDTRKLNRGDVFFALSGERTDGHEFLRDAERRGAAAAVVERTVEEGRLPPALIQVVSTQLAMTRCAELVRSQLSDACWIALTGSNGKTTTRELIAAGLSLDRRVHRTPGNYNNHLGVPLTMLAMPGDSEIAVIELAMSGYGEIDHLTRLTDPDIALLTNIRTVHMASFDSIDDVAAAKGELFARLRDDAIAVVNLDDALVRVQAARHVGPRVTFGQSPDADLQMEQIENRFFPGAAFSFRYQQRSIRLQLRLGGSHSAFNALAALATVVAAGGDIEAAASRMEQVEPGPGRGKVHELGREMLLIDDTYNSSPPALGTVLETLRLSDATRKVVILGDMLELGSMESALHGEAGRRIAAAGVQMLVTVGSLSRETAESARRAGVSEVHHFNDSRKAAGSIAGYLRDGDLIVVKGSRGTHMGRVVRELTSSPRTPGEAR